MKVISLDGSINHLGMGPGCNGAMKAWSHRLGGRGEGKGGKGGKGGDASNDQGRHRVISLGDETWH